MSIIKGYDRSEPFTTQSAVNQIIADSWHGTSSPFFMGRYLTNADRPEDNVPNPDNKKMTLAEVKLLSKNNINIVSIYQEIAFSLTKFTYQRGMADAERAVQAAAAIHQPSGTPIYFAAEVKWASLDSAGVNVLHQYLQGIRDALYSNIMNPNGYTFGVYGPKETCNRIKTDWYPTVLTFFGKPYSSSFNSWTIKQDNSPSGYTGGLIGIVDFDKAQTSSYGGWQYHVYSGNWQNYGSNIYHRKKCSLCDQYKYEPHVPNSSGTYCTVCGYTGNIISPSSDPSNDPTE